MTDVHTLAIKGDAAGLLALVQNSKDVHPVLIVNQYAYGRTALHHAARHGHYDAARALILCKADVNALEANNGETPLHTAACYGSTSVAMLLCDRGARINQVDKHYAWTALHHACERGDLATACALLDREQRCIDGHCAVDAQDRDGFTPLHHALINGFPDVGTELMQRGANPQAQAHNGWNALHCASRRGLRGICLQLIHSGKVLLNVEDKSGYTALDIAHPTRINKDELEKASVNFHRMHRRADKELDSIAQGKVLCIAPPKKPDNKLKGAPSRVRTSAFAEQVDLTVPPDDFEEEAAGGGGGEGEGAGKSRMAEMAAEMLALQRAFKQACAIDAAKPKPKKKYVPPPADAKAHRVRMVKPHVSPTFRGRTGGAKKSPGDSDED